MMTTEYEDNGHSDDAEVATVEAPKPKRTRKPKVEATVEAEPEAILPSRDVLYQARLLFTHLNCDARLAILLVLNRGETHVGQLGEHLNATQPAVSHHLALMRHGGIILPRRQGKHNYYYLTEKGKILAEVVSRIVA